MNEQVKWCLYDPETKTKTADLATDEAQMTILKMQPVDQDTQDEIERTFTNSCIDAQKTLAATHFKAVAVNPTPEGSLCDKIIPTHFHNSLVEVVIINSAATNKYFEKIKISGKK